MIPRVVGTAIRKFGQGLDVLGQQFEFKPCVEKLVPSTRVVKFGGNVPSINNTFVASTGTVVGKVSIGNNSFVGYGAVIRGDGVGITIGDNVHVGDRVMVHVNGQKDSTPTIIGNNVTINAGAIVPCSSHAHNKGLENLIAPPHDAEAHYHDLLNKTRIFRDIPMHKYHYSGPWIENHWINHFMSKPFKYFNGLVPLFVQFVDIHVYDFEDPARPVKNASIPTQKESVEILLTMLRHDVIYLVVSQDDQGIGTKLMSQFPNILVLSAGGYGHVPIPLIMGEINFEKPHVDNKYSTEVGFYGSLRPALSRSRMLHEFEGYARSIHLNYKTAQTNDWVKLMVDTKYNLAPRGYGRTSFRLAEIVQSGRVPVYMFDDVRWLPYEGTNMSISNYGFVGQMGRLLPTVNELKSTDDNKYTHKILAVKEVRELFTYSGVIKQIEQFIADPLGPNGGYLRCTRLPDKDHRRLSRGYDLHNEP